jgi:tetratricopeptide (TPR) repeat protein
MNLQTDIRGLPLICGSYSIASFGRSCKCRTYVSRALSYCEANLCEHHCAGHNDEGYFAAMSDNLMQQAEFLFRVSAENSADKLRAMLKPYDFNRELPILHRLNELYQGQNLNVLLRLAVRYWTEGLDDEAMSVLKQAQSINPYEHRVLRLGLFFEVTFGSPDEARSLAQHLLDLYPDDDWATALKRKLEIEDVITSVSLPSLETEFDSDGGNKGSLGQ